MARRPTTRNAPGVRPDWVDDELFPFASRFVAVDGGHTLHHVDEGPDEPSAPVLLLHHGNPTWSFLYRDVIAGLRDRFRCIAVDLPGFGLSTPGPGFGYQPAEHADAMAAFVRELDLSDITVFVQDWGGPTGLAPAVRMPERYRRLIIGNTWAWENDAVGARVFSNVLGGPVGRALIQRFNLFATQIVPWAHRARRLTDAEIDHYTFPFPDHASRLPTAIFPRAITRSSALLGELERGLHVLADKPALLLWAMEDVAFRKPELERWRRELPDHTLVRLPGVGHYLQDDAPAEVVAAIRRWWDDLA